MSELEGGAPKRASGFLSLPSTGVGKWSAWLLLVSIVLVLFNNIVVMPRLEQQASVELAQQAFNLAVFMCFFLAGLTGLFAIVSKRERSWVAFVSVLLLVVVAAFNAGPLFHG